MRVSVSDAGPQLAELLRLAEAGDEVLLTREGKPVARMVPVTTQPAVIDRTAVLEKVRASGPNLRRPVPTPRIATISCTTRMDYRDDQVRYQFPATRR
jgi:prevent-host-death family protein